MKRYQTILVGAALDDRDGATLRHAACFAQAAGTKTVYIAHVTPSLDLSADQSEQGLPVETDIGEQLRGLIKAHRSRFPAGATIQPVERQGSLLPELIRLAAQKSADLLCLARRPEQDDDRLSDMAVRLVRKTPCSVLVVPPETEARYSRILVPVDFSDHAREALEVACALAQSMEKKADVTALHVYSVPLGWHKSPHSHEEFAAIMKSHAERHWAEFLPKTDTHGINVAIRYALGDKVPKTILEAAADTNADLLILGSHGRTLPAGFLLGHVADSVCARTPRAVLCVKRKGEVVNLLNAMLQFFEFKEE